MKQITLLAVCLIIAGCGLLLSNASYRSVNEVYIDREASQIPESPPPAPAPPPPSIENSQTREMIKIPSSKTYDRDVKSVPTIEQATFQIMNQLFVTSTAIVADTEASINETVLITLVIDPTVDEIGLLEHLASENSDQSIITNTTKISSLAWPVIIAPDFLVEPNEAAEQAITKDSQTTWTWQLKPKAGGMFTVIVELYAIVYIGNERTKKKYKTLKQPITITVPPEPTYIKVWNWIDDKWEWVWTVIMIPLIGFIWKRYKKKKKKS